MNERQMKIYADLYKTLSTTKTANNLYLSQPAISKVLHEIEEEYGVQLFERISHKLYRTPYSDEVYISVCNALESLQSLENTLKQEKSKEVIRIGASITLGTYFLPELVSSFQKSHPSVSIQVKIFPGQTIVDMLLNYELDLAFVEGKSQNPRLKQEVLLKDELVVIAPKEHELTSQKQISLQTLAQYPLLMRDQASKGRQFADLLFLQNGLELSPFWESVSTSALIEAVHLGLGLSILSKKLVQPAIDAGLVAALKVRDVKFQRENYILIHAQKTYSKNMQELIDAAKRQAQN
jgi:DNA-binding transcriptional LysR family regulator